MKQIDKSAKVIAKLRKAVGNDVDVEKLAVYEAIALNTLPIRKRHPIYRKGRVDKAMLEEMATSLSKESLPLQVMHNGEVLPVGRVFHGEVVDSSKGNAELRVLFFVDAESDYAKNIDLGIVDQVSVSFLSKQILCSDCGFDFLGPESTFDNKWTGTCSHGHVLGEGKTYAKLVGLDDWSEMSLVNRGGAQNARIVSKDKSHFVGQTGTRLLASGVDPNELVLTASAAPMEYEMDFDKLAAELVDLRVEKRGFETEIVTLKSNNDALKGKVTELEAKLAEAGDVAASLAAKDEEINTLKADAESKDKVATDATAALKDVAKTLLIAGGDVDPSVPDTVAELTALIAEQQKSLAALLVIGGKSKSAAGDVKLAAKSGNAFRTPGR